MNPGMKATTPKTSRNDAPGKREQAFTPRYPAELPITDKREEIVRAIRQHQVLVITGETGSGKSTQIPKMCLEAGRGRPRKIGCTQPRRIAAVTLANRVAEELDRFGKSWVGHKIRFQDRTTRNTRIKFMTDGILLAEAQSDRLFKAYDTLIIDEAHERTLNIDFLLGLIKKILPRRPDLKVIITSATIDPERFSQAFGNAPIIEVSGRTYPVEVWYRPIEASAEDEDEISYVDQAVAAVDMLKKRTGSQSRGDVLIFMPTESDIRETVQRLEERRYFNTLVLPLFGRMAAADQHRIFKASSEDKIIVATNVAETSITIPRIKYVIDTGLARISQYNVRSRTQGLPVLPISQASANQRKGRCGRVEAGVCIRLYAEEDYLARPLYTPAEIQRSNLAEVILRMLSLRLGSIQDFPFLDPPSPAAIKDGFAVLRELNAVDDHRRLTNLGRTMARLPLDPRLSRMIAQAVKEKSLPELTVLAAALSIQDPRERPLDQEAQADQAHAKFRDTRSDFVTLLKIWHAYEEELTKESGKRLTSQSQMRKFCRENFLAYRKMREWRDVREEIREILEELNIRPTEQSPASYEAIHRAVASGYLSHIGLRKEKNIYLTAKNRQAMIFPGSGLFNKAGSWIVASEMVHTSRFFARTVADIQPEWLEELGGHLCRRSYSEPHWEKKRGAVVAFERVTLYGLPIVARRKVGYSRINPAEAREIFIRTALVEGELAGRYGFYEHNRRLIQKIEELESKSRRRDLLVDDATIYDFYEERIPRVGGSNLPEDKTRVIADARSFDKFLKERGGDEFLRMTEADLLRTRPDFGALMEYPDTLKVQDLDLPLSYSFAPGDEEDGVTVTIPVHGLAAIPQEPFEWLVPGMLLEKITVLLKTLPKNLRKQLVPVADCADQLFTCLEFGQGSLHLQLSHCLRDLKRVDVSPAQWNESQLPRHLCMRFKVVGSDGKVLGSGRDLQKLKALSKAGLADDLWDKARREYERAGLTAWEFDRMSPKLELGKDALGLEIYAYPGLVAEGDAVAVRLFKDPQEARRASYRGLILLYQLVFHSELKQLKKEWVYPSDMVLELAFMGSRKEADEHLKNYLLEELFQIADTRFSAGWPDHSQYLETLRKVKGKLALTSRQRLLEVLTVVRERENIRLSLERFRQMARKDASVLQRMRILNEELDRLVPADFPEHCSRFEIQQLPRYLKALEIRAERAYTAPEKDRTKEAQYAPYKEYYRELRETVGQSPSEQGAYFVEEFRWLLEEFKISLFAPEVKTRVRVSGKRLEEKYREWMT